MAWVAVDRAVRTSSSAARGPGRRVAGAARRDPRRDLREGLRRERGAFTQYYGSDAARRQPAHDPAGRLPARRRPPGRSAPSRPSSATHRGRLRPALPGADADDVDGLRAARVPSSPARSGWPTASADRPARRRQGAASSGCSRCATTSACCPRSTTRRRRQVGNFPQAFSHMSLVNTRLQPRAGHDARPSATRAGTIARHQHRGRRQPSPCAADCDPAAPAWRRRRGTRPVAAPAFEAPARAKEDAP